MPGNRRPARSRLQAVLLRCCVSDFDDSKPFSAHIPVSSSVWCEVLRHFSQDTECTLMCVMKWSWAQNLQSLRVMLNQGCALTSHGWSIHRTSGTAGWMLVLQHCWCSSSSPLWRAHTCQCWQCLCSPCTQDRGSASTPCSRGDSGALCCLPAACRSLHGGPSCPVWKHHCCHRWVG